MLNVEEMSREEIKEFLASGGYGHLGLAQAGLPYVVPMHYVFADECAYFVTTEGEKTKMLAANPEVCLQVEAVRDVNHWRSVMVTGQAEKLIYQAEIETAMHLLTKNNPTLTPVLNYTKMGGQGRPNFLALYRLRPSVMDGRKTVGDSV